MVENQRCYPTLGCGVWQGDPPKGHGNGWHLADWRVPPRGVTMGEAQLIRLIHPRMCPWVGLIRRRMYHCCVAWMGVTKARHSSQAKGKREARLGKAHSHPYSYFFFLTFISKELYILCCTLGLPYLWETLNF